MLLDESHFYLEILNEHIDCVVILLAEGYDEVGVLHSRLDEVVICRLHKSVVLGQYIDHGATTLSNVSLNLKI